ncbi:MAG: hypothetical protein NUV55_12585 [Sulfuricaulis sp.]|uniref:hypothetical protein n=1 Tax=Sulfuricaulis sp. TaxID=2003553 RepID=UPI0025E306BA|nr:hypothetical protein [Sulfuricaulis sp.]MCR4348018.1 hypothetical protein [Sulfuricaulis sp.]
MPLLTVTLCRLSVDLQLGPFRFVGWESPLRFCVPLGPWLSAGAEITVRKDRLVGGVRP